MNFMLYQNCVLSTLILLSGFTTGTQPLPKRVFQRQAPVSSLFRKVVQ